MDIWTETRFKDFFAWQFSERERKLPEAKEFVEQIKAQFQHGKERMFFREEKRWLIHKTKFIEFMDLYLNMIKNIVFKQKEIYLG